MPDFKDHFSSNAAGYARFRPEYPSDPFDWLAGLAPGRDHALECGCGNGQATRMLATRFETVFASDASAEQIAEASGPPNVRFFTAPAEESGLPDAAVSLLLAAQAAHWFDLPAFYREAQRVLKPGGVIALLTYDAFEIAPEIDRHTRGLLFDTLDGYWPPEREYVRDGYRSLDFPFAEIPLPEFELRADWDLQRTIGYMDTWSGLKRYRAQVGEDPLEDVRRELRPLWGEGTRRVRWKLNGRVGRVV